MQKKIFSQVVEMMEKHQKGWLATVVNVEGSTPAKAGMKMLIALNEGLSGTIGGGAVEIEVVNRVRRERPAQIERWSYDLDGGSMHEKSGMICGGVQEILIEPLFNHHDLYIIGGGHCGQALSELAARCDFHVTVIDDRKAVATKENHPFAARVICCPYRQVNQHIGFSKETYLVVMTHGHQHDGLVVQKVLNKTYKYLGVIGSDKKIKDMFAALQKKGSRRAMLKKVFAPIGLPIGSQTPMEIAISILAQLIAVKKGKANIVFNSNPLKEL